MRGPVKTTLFRYAGKGAWHFAIIPNRVAPPPTRLRGRTPRLPQTTCGASARAIGRRNPINAPLPWTASRVDIT